ncbi:MAG: M50 family metallopeptidase [Acidobacteria bacterium]|nr:M50 family metallopeptidase [Acidobacteriota bacterium]
MAVYRFADCVLARGTFQGSSSELVSGRNLGMAIITALLFFVAIVAHELSHAVVAVWRGLPVSSITLFALGGVAQLEKEPEDPTTEFLVSIVGPIASAVIGFICLLLAWVLGWTRMAEPTTPLMAMLVWLGYINIGLAISICCPDFHWTADVYCAPSSGGGPAMRKGQRKPLH